MERSESSSNDFSTQNVMVGFIGSGKMAQAMCNGFLSSGMLKKNQLFLSDPNQNQAAHIEKLGVSCSASNTEVVDQTNIVFLAVKPYKVRPVLKEIRNKVTKNHLIVSIAAGVSIDSMQEQLPSGSRVIRVMPNTPALVRAGASAYVLGSHANSNDGKIVKELLSSIGLVEQVEEKYIDAVCGLSGSGPAYMFLAIEALSDGGVKMGLTRDLAIKLAAQTMLGAAKMVLDTGKHPAELKDAVCSPSGTTIAAVSELERCGYRNALICAVEAAANRATELKEQDKQESADNKSKNKVEPQTN